MTAKIKKMTEEHLKVIDDYEGKLTAMKMGHQTELKQSLILAESFTI